jgi:hypothetical protein
LGTNDAANILAIDVKFGSVAVDNLFILGILDNLAYLLDRPVNIGSSTTYENNIFSCSIANLSADLDRKGVVLSDDSARS